MTQAYLATMPGARPVPMILKLILALPVVSMIAIAPASSAGYSYEEQEACTGDAFRLCSDYIPNIPRITACMQAKRDQLSPACAKMFEPGRERHMEDPERHPDGDPDQPDQPY